MLLVFSDKINLCIIIMYSQPANFFFNGLMFAINKYKYRKKHNNLQGSKYFENLISKHIYITLLYENVGVKCHNTFL